MAVRTGSYDILRQVTPEPSRSSKRVCIGSSRPFFDPPSRLCHGSVRVMRRRTEPANHAARCSSIRKGMTSAFGALESPATMAHLSLPKSGGPVKYFPSDVDRFRPQFDGKHPKAEVGAPEPRPAVELPIIRNNASGPKLPPLRCTVPGSRIRDRRTGTAQNGYLGQKREQSADQRGTIQKPHLKLVTTKSAALQVRWATTL